MNVKFNDLYQQYLALQQEIDEAMHSVIKRSCFVKGSDIDEFEMAFSDFCGGGYTAAVANGTDAILLGLIALGVKAGDEVIVPAQSFIATIEPIIALGAKPVFVDIHADTYTLAVDQLEAAITAKTKVIIAVHLYGLLADMKAICAIANEHKLRVLEDSAQAHGASYQGHYPGHFGDIATYSFFPGKNLGAFGDAGAVFAKDRELIEHIKSLRDHGRAPGVKFAHTIMGYNSRMDTIQAAVLKVKLKYLPKWTRQRREIAALYSQLLAGVVKLPYCQQDHAPAYHLYVIATEHRDELRTHLQSFNIASGIHYPQALHQHQSVIDLYGSQAGQFPVAEQAVDRILSLPIYPDMPHEQIHYVAQAIKAFTNQTAEYSAMTTRHLDGSKSP